LLPYYKYLSKQPGLFFENDDSEWLQIQIEYGGVPKVKRFGKKDKGGDMIYNKKNLR